MDTAPAFVGAAEPGARFATSATMQGGRAWFGLMSVVLHGLVLGALLMFVGHVAKPTPPDETSVEMVFQPAAEPPPPQEPVAEPAPPQPEAAIEAPTEPPPISPVPEPMMAPEPAPSPPLQVAPPPRPKPRPLPRVTPAQTVKPPDAPAAPSVPPAAAPSPPPAAAAAVVDPAWQAAVFSWISSRKTYPEEARRRGEEGRVAIRFTIDRTGRVLEAAVVGSSGSELLDQAALSLLRQASLPAFPAGMTQTRITITTALRYSLR